MKEKFLAEYEIDHMNNNSLTVVNKRTGKHCFIHRNTFNQLIGAVDYREIEVEFPDKNGNCRVSYWIEILTWKRI